MSKYIFARGSSAVGQAESLAVSLFRMRTRYPAHHNWQLFGKKSFVFAFFIIIQLEVKQAQGAKS